MMKRKLTFLGAFLVLLVIVALAHAFVHLTFYGTGYEGFAKRGLTGMAVEGSDTEESGLPVSEIILFLEWGLIFLGAIFVYAKHKIDLKKELDYLTMLKQKKHFHGGTELDNFYELLKEMKHFRLSNASKVFDVDYDIIEDWAHSLETAEVAELTYPRIGGPEVHLVSEKKEGDEKGKKEDKEGEKDKKNFGEKKGSENVKEPEKKEKVDKKEGSAKESEKR